MKKQNVKRTGKKVLAFGLATAMVWSLVPELAPTGEVQAQYKAGTAPYINNWLVAGPSANPVVEDNDTSDGSEVEYPETVEQLKLTSVTGSTVLNGNEVSYGADKAIDGNVDTYWATDTRQGQTWDDERTLTVDLEKVSTVTSLKVATHERNGKKLDIAYKFSNKRGRVVKSGSVENLTVGELTEIKFDNAIGNVASITFIVNERRDTGNTAPNHLGLKEVEVYGAPGESEDNTEEITITPELGDEFGDSKWQYFDDRIFNRNTDDWQDLSGYFTVKQGVETDGKYVYAHTYVYSPKAQDVQLRMVTSGTHKAWLNDELVSEASVAVESTDKDKYKANVSLKEGWNKLLVEINHTRTSYLGFYARLCDGSGNEIEDLTYSVMGGQTDENELQIITQGLDIDKAAFEERNAEVESNMYPENELPYGYVDYPYVWNKPYLKPTSSYGPQASHFKFQAAGGAPEYTWEIVEGKLPDGLTMDETGEIDGFCTKTGEYPITVEVTDADGNKAEKSTKIVVKERPSKWFEEGKMSALSHNTGGYIQYWDENYSWDAWAERAKNAGMTMLSTEAVQSVFYWDAPGTFPGQENSIAERQHPNTTEVIDGVVHVRDMLTPIKEAVERHGMRFGLYYASEGSNRYLDSRNNCSSGFYANVNDLVCKYDPSYLFFDGAPQSRGNIDAVWSAVRAYNDYALIQANDQCEASDNDITIRESDIVDSYPYSVGGYWETNMYNQNKYTVEEIWSHPFGKELGGWWAPYSQNAGRDNWRMWAEFIISSIGHGYVANYDQMNTNTRGVDSPSDPGSVVSGPMYYPYMPVVQQRFITMRDTFNNWLANGEKPDLRESLYGTMPYYFDTYTKLSGWHENSEKEPFLTAKYGEGPEWGYAVGRDQFVYMHMLKTQNRKVGKAKKGFQGEDSIKVGPFDYDVTKVEWLNEGNEIGFETVEENGKKYITIDTSDVTADPIDTVLKITTADPKRDFKLTSVKLYSNQEKADTLQLRAEAYMKNFTSVFAPAKLAYSSSNPAVATVDQNGLVKAAGEGKTTIKVIAEYEGVTKEDTYPVQVKADGSISPDLDLVGVVLRTDGMEALGNFAVDDKLPVTLEGRTEKGGGIDLLAPDSVTWHYGICSGIDHGPAAPDEYWQAREVENFDLFNVSDGELKMNKAVSADETYAIWADVTVGDQTFTTNINYLRFGADEELSKGIVPKVSSGTGAEDLTDGVLNTADGGNTSKWTADKDDENPSITFDVGSVKLITDVKMFYNNSYRRYMNQPEAIKIEVSNDEKEWQEVELDKVKYYFAANIGSAQKVQYVDPVPDNNMAYWWEDDMYTHAVNKIGRYVRISFPGGALNEQLDVLETQIFGIDATDVLSNIEVTKEVSADKKELALDVKGFTDAGKSIDLADAVITVTSEDENVATVDGTKVKAVAEGITNIQVTAKKGRFQASDKFMVKVNKDGEIKELVGYTLEDLPLEGMTATAGSEETSSENNSAGNVLDNKSNTIWHTKWSGSAKEDRWIDINLGGSKKINGLRLLQRSGSSNGIIQEYRIEVSNDNGATYQEVARGAWADDVEWNKVQFAETNATNVRLYAEKSVANFAAAAEIRITTLKKSEDTLDGTFEITVDGETTEHKYNDAVTIEAAAEKDGKKFAYWMAGDEIVSYDTVYKFYVSKSMEFKAVYTDEAIETKPAAMLTNIFVTKRTDMKSDVRFVGELVIPEGYKVVEAGLIWSSKNTELILDKDTENPRLNPALKPTYITKISDTNQFSVTIKGMPQGKSIRGSIFATVTNGTETKLVYSAEQKADAAK